jgi:predicted Rossmann fold flavoprotein
MKLYDVVVVGAGPAGMMAAIRIGQLSKSVVLIEKNDILGKKLKITGSNRCNITNTASFNIFLEKFGKRGSFFRSAFSTFSSRKLITFFKVKGLKFKVEDDGRVFPVTDRSRSVIKVLKEYLSENNVIKNYNTRLINIKKKKDYFSLDLGNDNYMATIKVILATGGVSYKATGSTGDGLDIAQKMGHNITTLKPGLVPLKFSASWVKELQGISLENIRIIIKYGEKKVISDNGNLIFTHFGISGPLILDLSNQIISILEKTETVQFFIDTKPEITIQELEEKLIKEFEIRRKSEFKNFMKFLLPNRMIPVFIKLLGMDPKKKVNQIKKEERNSIINLLKAFPLTITGSLGVDKAMITCGGVSRREINPQTMESKLIPGLYFAGEIIEGCAPSGGYNLQQAFSTGYLAGEAASNKES